MKWQQAPGIGRVSRERRRGRGSTVRQEAIEQGGLRKDLDIEATIDAFYAPIYYRLQMGTGPITEAYVDKVYEQAIEGQRQRMKREHSYPVH